MMHDADITARIWILGVVTSFATRLGPRQLLAAACYSMHPGSARRRRHCQLRKKPVFHVTRKYVKG